MGSSVGSSGPDLTKQILFPLSNFQQLYVTILTDERTLVGSGCSCTLCGNGPQLSEGARDG